MQRTAQSWFVGGPSSSISSEQQSPPSLLADWNSYASSRSASETPSDGVGSSNVSFDIEAAVGTTNGKVSGIFGKVSKRFWRPTSNFQSARSSVPSAKSLLYFGLFLAFGIFLIFIAFTMFLPIMVLMPQKFALCFTAGCAFIVGSFFALKGPKNQLFHMLSRKRLPFTLGFIGSMVGTMYVSMVLHSYILSVLFSVLQVLALSYYAVSYFPGGSAGLKFLSATLTSSIMRCFRG